MPDIVVFPGEETWMVRYIKDSIHMHKLFGTDILPTPYFVSAHDGREVREKLAERSPEMIIELVAR